jgi:hypothetical protein
MHFQRHSPYLCSLLSVMAASPLPKKGTTAWGAHLYQRTLRRLLHAGVRPFEVLPWCLTDPRNCRVDKRVPDPFKSDPAWFMGKRWAAGGRDALKVRADRDRQRRPSRLTLRIVAERTRLRCRDRRLCAAPPQSVAEELPGRRLGPEATRRADRAHARLAASRLDAMACVSALAAEVMHGGQRRWHQRQLGDPGGKGKRETK